MKTSDLDVKRPTRIPQFHQVKLPEDIGKYIARDVEEVTRLGWTESVRLRRGQGCSYFLLLVEHLAQRLLQKYKHCGVPVVLMTGEWTEEERLAALALRIHKYAIEHAPFLRKEFALMVEKGLPYLVAKRLLGLMLSPPW